MSVPEVMELTSIRALRHAIRLRHQKHRDAVAALPNASRLPIWSMSMTPELDLLQFPHAVGAAFDALCRLESSQVDLVDRRLSQGTRDPRAIEMVNRSETYPLTFAIDSYLESAVRAQNGAWHYASKAFGVSDTPESLRDAVKQLRKDGIKGIPTVVASSIVSYWESGGQRLRAYRVLSQHFALVSSDVRLRFAPDGSASIFLALPSDPAVTKPAGLRYDNPVVLALPYCTETFVHLIRWIYELARLIAPDAPRAPQGVVSMLMGPLMVGDQFNGHRVGNRGDVADAIGKLAMNCDQEPL
jgi:hypothetical protein